MHRQADLVWRGKLVQSEKCKVPDKGRTACVPAWSVGFLRSFVQRALMFIMFNVRFYLLLF